MRGMTRCGWLTSSRTCPWRSWGGCAADRVLHFPVPQRQPGTHGRPPRHGRELALADPATWPGPAVTTATQTTRCGTATAQAQDRLHPRLTHRSAWLDHDARCP